VRDRGGLEPATEPSWYEGVGHTAHLEEPERFNRELAALTRLVSSQGSPTVGGSCRQSPSASSR
jgi:hypothetical protein